MPEVEYTTTMTLEPEAIWEFVKDMNNWAPFLTGYQQHEILSDTDSIWTLKGDVGILCRIVRLQAHVTEWNGPERVSFTLKGLNELVEGDGTLTMRRREPTTEERTPKPKRPWFLRRMIQALFRWWFRRIHGRPPALPASDRPAASELTFRLRMDAGGPTGPLVNAMLGPALLPAAESLAQKIAHHLETSRARA